MDSSRFLWFILPCSRFIGKRWSISWEPLYKTTKVSSIQNRILYQIRQRIKGFRSMFSDVFRGCFRDRPVNSAMKVACKEKSLRHFQHRLYREKSDSYAAFIFRICTASGRMSLPSTRSLLTKPTKPLAAYSSFSSAMLRVPRSPML